MTVHPASPIRKADLSNAQRAKEAVAGAVPPRVSDRVAWVEFVKRQSSSRNTVAPF